MKRGAEAVLSVAVGVGIVWLALGAAAESIWRRFVG